MHRAVQRYYPDLRQVACFDTAFHRQMPELAHAYPLARSLWHEGVRRYGFHGLSYEYVVEKLKIDAPAEANGRLIVAHLGNGASMTAIRNGASVETTMGLTPAGGLMMGTRSGDLDPGILIYLLQEKGRSTAAIDYLVNQRSGLVGVSDISSDIATDWPRKPRNPMRPRRWKCTVTMPRNGSVPWPPCLAGSIRWCLRPASAHSPR